jgi:lipopolysaccharide biosynthesis regulator YciM
MMKRIILTLTITVLSLSAFSQSDYNEVIKQGDAAVKSGNYTTAIKKYLAARSIDESKIKEVYAKIDSVYTKIDAEHKEYEELKAKQKTPPVIAKAKNKDCDDVLSEIKKIINMAKKNNKNYSDAEKLKDIKTEISKYKK